MKRILIFCLSILLSASTYSQTYNNNLLIDFDSLGVRNFIVGEKVPPANITLYSSDSSGGSTQYYAFSNNGFHNAYIASYDSAGSVNSVLSTSTGSNFSYSSIDSKTSVASSSFKTYAQKSTPEITKLSIESAYSLNPYKAVRINIEGNGAKRFVYGEYGVSLPLQGMQYDKTGYVTQLHSLTDKEYVDKNQMSVLSKTTLPPPSIGRIIYVSNATGGACPAYSDGTNWRRFSDNSIID